MLSERRKNCRIRRPQMSSIVEVHRPLFVLRQQTFEILVGLAVTHFEFRGEVGGDQVGGDNMHDRLLEKFPALRAIGRSGRLAKLDGSTCAASRRHSERTT